MLKPSCKPLEFIRTGCFLVAEEFLQPYSNLTESHCSHPVMIGLFVKSCDVGSLLLRAV